MPDSGVTIDNGTADFDAATYLDGSSRHHAKSLMEFDGSGTPTKVSDSTPMPAKMRSVSTIANAAPVTVTTSATVLAAANPNRVALLLWVEAGGPVYVGTTAVAIGTGMPLLFAGDPPVVFDGNSCPVNEVRGIVAAGTATVRVQEITG